MGNNIQFEEQLKKSGLDIPANWQGDPRHRFEILFEPLMKGTSFSFKHNTTDHSSKILEVYRGQETRRIMGIRGKRDMVVTVFFNPDLYQEIEKKVALPGNEKSYRSQPHMDISKEKAWNVICALTDKLEYMVGEDNIAVQSKKRVEERLERWNNVTGVNGGSYFVNDTFKLLRERVKEFEYFPKASEFDAIMKLHPKKDVLWIKRKSDGKLLVAKRYEQYNKNVFKILKSLNIQGIPRIYLIEEKGGFLYTFEDYIEGVDLEALLSNQGVFEENEVINIAIKICEILETIHGLKVPLIHRDIKPSNIIVSVTGDIYLIDFNVSKEIHEGNTQDTVYGGTQDFAAPEQVGYGTSDARTDIYGLGVTMNYLLTKMSPVNLIAPGRLEDIIRKCTEVSKKDRYKSAKELRKELEKVRVV